MEMPFCNKEHNRLCHTISNIISQNSCSDIFHINGWINCHCWSYKVIYSKITLVTEQYRARTSIKDRIF